MELLQSHAVHCPCCGEQVELLVDSSVPVQRYTEDCPVCCRPMVVDASVDREGLCRVTVAAENG